MEGGWKESENQAKGGWKEDGRRTKAKRKGDENSEKKEKNDGKRPNLWAPKRTHLHFSHRKIATHLPQNYTFVFNGRDVWRKCAILGVFV